MSQAQVSPTPLISNRVLSLCLSHFRNYHSARIEVQENLIVLIGPNGAGKTNVLEAISLLTPGRGLRRAELTELDNMQDYALWAVAAEISGAQGEAAIGTGRDNPLPLGEGRVRGESDGSIALTPTLSQREREKRIVKIDGKVARSQNDLARFFAALWLTPQMDTLFIEGGSARRKFLDRMVYSFDSEHASRINAYEYAMRERNRLLAEGRADPMWLSALEQKMAEQGIAIAVARSHAVEELNRAMQLSNSSFPKAVLALKGAVEEALAGSSALKAEEKFGELLAQSRPQDAAAGRTLSGVHRTQLEVIHLAKNMPAERCSSGEQKALLVSMVLAQARAGAAWHGRVPALLLDEVAAHLDATRRSELFTELSTTGAQCWLTGTDREIFQGIKAQFLCVESGAIKT